MANMSLKKLPMPEQDPLVRNKNFEEVALGYTAEMAVNEAKRCLNCKNKPCVSACPVCIDIPPRVICLSAVYQNNTNSVRTKQIKPEKNFISSNEYRLLRSIYFAAEQSFVM